MPPVANDLAAACGTNGRDAALKCLHSRGGQRYFAAAFFGFGGRPHHSALLLRIVNLVIDLQIAAVQVDILDGESGTFPRPQAGMQQDDKQIAVAAAVGVGIHKIQKGGLLLRRERLPFGLRLPLEKIEPERKGVPAGGALLHGIFEHRGQERVVIADGFVGKSPLMEPGEVQLAIPYRDVLCLAAPQLILLQVGDGIAVAAPCALPQVRAQLPGRSGCGAVRPRSSGTGNCRPAAGFRRFAAPGRGCPCVFLFLVRLAYTLTPFSATKYAGIPYFTTFCGESWRCFCVYTTCGFKNFGRICKLV